MKRHGILLLFVNLCLICSHAERQSRYRDLDDDTYEITSELNKKLVLGCLGEKRQDYDEILELFMEDSERKTRSVVGFEEEKVSLRLWPHECIHKLSGWSSHQAHQNQYGSVPPPPPPPWNYAACKCPPGDPGPDGPQGAIGPAGVSGANGRDGKNGANGRRGRDGQKGFPGHKGQKGAKGAVGDPGAEGPQGPAGHPGAAGGNGRNGLKGPKGPRGRNGTPGTDGEDGRQGIPGQQGPPGQNGSAGLPGRDGPAAHCQNGNVGWKTDVQIQQERSKEIFSNPKSIKLAGNSE